MKPHSHLYTVIQRVKRVIRVNKDSPDQQKLHAVLPHAFNLAEYISYESDFTPDEEREARRLLGLLGIPANVDETHGLGYNEIANKLLGEGKIVKIPSRHCRRCGRSLSNVISVQHGLGPICLSKQTREDALATRAIDREGTIDGINILANEVDKEGSNDVLDNEKHKEVVKKTDDSKQLPLF